MNDRLHETDLSPTLINHRLRRLEICPCFLVRRVGPYRFPKVVHSLLKFTGGRVDDSQIVVRFTVIRGNGHGMLQVIHCIGIMTLHSEFSAQQREGPHVIRIKLDGFFQPGYGQSFFVASKKGSG